MRHSFSLVEILRATFCNRYMKQESPITSTPRPCFIYLDFRNKWPCAKGLLWARRDAHMEGLGQCRRRRCSTAGRALPVASNKSAKTGTRPPRGQGSAPGQICCWLRIARAQHQQEAIAQRPPQRTAPMGCRFRRTGLTAMTEAYSLPVLLFVGEQRGRPQQRRRVQQERKAALVASSGSTVAYTPVQVQALARIRESVEKQATLDLRTSFSAMRGTTGRGPPRTCTIYLRHAASRSGSARRTLASACH